MQLKLIHLRILLFLCGLGFGGHALSLWIHLGNTWGRTYLAEYASYCFALVVFVIHALLSWWLLLATARARMTRVSTINTVTQIWLLLMAVALVAVAAAPSLMNYAAVALTVDAGITTKVDGILTVRTIIPAMICIAAAIILYVVQRRVQSQLVDDIQIIAKHPTDRCGIAFSTSLLLAIVCGQLARNFYLYRTSPELDADMNRYNTAVTAYNQQWLSIGGTCQEPQLENVALVLLKVGTVMSTYGAIDLQQRVLAWNTSPAYWGTYTNFSSIPSNERTHKHSLLCSFTNATAGLSESEKLVSGSVGFEDLYLYRYSAAIVNISASTQSSLAYLDIIISYTARGEGDGGTGADGTQRPAQIAWQQYNPKTKQPNNNTVSVWQNQAADTKTGREPSPIPQVHIVISCTESRRLVAWFNQLYAVRSEYHGAIATSKSMLYAQINFTIALLALCTAVAFAIRCEMHRRHDPHGSDMQDFVTIKMKDRSGHSVVSGSDEIALPDTSEWETASVTDDKFTIEDIGTDGADGVEEL